MNLSDIIKDKFGEMTVTEYMAGKCQNLAMALNRIDPNLDLVAILDYDEDVESECLTHALVFDNKSLRYIDINGYHDSLTTIICDYEDHGSQYFEDDMSISRLIQLCGEPKHKDIDEADEIASFIISIINNKGGSF